MDAYQYDELPPNAFRYLILLPGTDHETLKCSLYSSQVSEVRYEAVSYVWGTDHRDHNILCDGKVLKITLNLHSVLQRLRLPDTPRTLWADSICINQSDLQEKCQQVILIGHIYRNAERVLVCISPLGSEHGPHVAALLKDVCSDIDSSLHRIYEEVNELERTNLWKLDLTPWDRFPYPGTDDSVLHDPRWASVSILVEQDWFARGWVVREAGLARQGLVIWGDTQFAWHDLMRVLAWRHRRATSSISIPGEDRFRSHLEAYEAQHQDIICTFYQKGSWKACSLLGYIHFARALQLKDPRDRIYAFLDLAKDSTRQLRVVPNYNDAPSKVYHDFARDYLLAFGDVEILHYTRYKENALEPTSMTWAPDWSIEEGNFFSFVLTTDNEPPLESRAGQLTEPKLLGGTTLQVEGVIMDSVHYLSVVLHAKTTTATVLFELWTSVRQSTPEAYYPTSDLIKAFFDAVSLGSCYGNLDEWKKAQQTYISVFERLTKEMYISNMVIWKAEDIAILESTSFHKSISSTTAEKRFVVTERGCYGLAPAVSREGDSCGIIFGCCSPCLLRESSIVGQHIYLGSCFILGKRLFDFDEYGMGFGACLGVEVSKDWTEWGVKEQLIYLS